MEFRIQKISFITLNFFNVDISTNIVNRPFKFGMLVLDIGMEGSLSQISFLSPSSYSM